VVRAASALVIGAGALGNEVAKNLAMMGVRLIVVVDRDTVEVANLTRSIFFREADHGRMKAEVLTKRLADFNPEVRILPLNGDLEEVLGLGLVRRMDMIFSCLDNRLARRSINRMCQKLAKPWVDGSMENLLGDVTVYLPDDGPCYECNLTRSDKEIIANATSCKHIALQNLAMGKVPTVSTMGSIISALQVQEALKLLHGDMKKSLSGRKLVVNCEINDFYITRAERKGDCEGHFRYGEIIEVSDWTSDQTSPQEILQRFEQDTGQEGHLRLGREIVTGLRCVACKTEEEFGLPLRLLSIENVGCPTCGEAREPVTTNVVRGDEPHAAWSLSRLGIPKLDILEARSPGISVWYELTGDADEFQLGGGVAERDGVTLVGGPPDLKGS
jgi:molybdopterin/thiamine biosynthesis adenylyltransferase